MTGTGTHIPSRPYEAITRKDIDRIPQLRELPPADLLGMKAISAVFPFRVNNYVIDELIDWDRIPEDPIYQLTFPQPGMLDAGDFRRMRGLLHRGAPRAEVRRQAREIQLSMNPHPGGQLELNVPTLDGESLGGIQHKYRETVLFFPAKGQTCHAYCTYCFRWAQFVGMQDLKFASRDAQQLVSYLKAHPEVRSVLFTGGDPLIMRTAILRRYIEPVLEAGLEHVTSIRIGTKAPAYWPYRFLSDPDADDLLRLFEEVIDSGRHLALMSHYSHPRELETKAAEAAVRRIRGTGAVVRSQAPLIGHVNDRAETWAELWGAQVRLGVVPYYLFVERDTGPKRYFEVPLAEALDIYRGACQQVSGLGRTARGPSMSAAPGKVVVSGVAELHGRKVFVLQLLQARDPEWVGRPFFARYDPRATWLDDLQPAFGEREFFFEPGLRKLLRYAPSNAGQGGRRIALAGGRGGG